MSGFSLSIATGRRCSFRIVSNSSAFAASRRSVRATRLAQLTPERNLDMPCRGPQAQVSAAPAMTCELRHRSAKKRRSNRLRPVPRRRSALPSAASANPPGSIFATAMLDHGTAQLGAQLPGGVVRSGDHLDRSAFSLSRCPKIRSRRKHHGRRSQFEKVETNLSYWLNRGVSLARRG
jgi:hypothetical protein